MDKEQILSGGQLSNVVRIGDTVRRPMGPWSNAVHALLRHLEEKNFDRVPKAIGVDEQQREILSYIPGETAGDTQPWPDWVWQDETISATGRWLRDYHEAVSDFREAEDAVWRMNWTPQRVDEIICHFDVAPYNIVRRPDGEISLIDWDVAAPGTPILELTKVVNSFSPVHDVKTRESLGFRKGVLNDAMLDCFVHRARLLLDAYELHDRSGFVDMLPVALMHSRDRIFRGAKEGDAPLQNLINAGVVEQLNQTATLYKQHRDLLLQGIEL